MVSERYEEGFAAPVEAALDGLMGQGVADGSPILEAMSEFLASVPGWDAGGAPREAVLVSDLVQHSGVLSFYRGEDWAAFAASGGTARLSRALDGAAVTILRLPRAGVDAGAVDDFWVRYLDAQGAAHVRTETLGDL
jgi:hypothetical protein